MTLRQFLFAAMVSAASAAEYLAAEMEEISSEEALSQAFRQRDFEEAPAAATTFELKFALTGPLGIEFNGFEYPYIVSKVHPGSVALQNEIRPNDELVSIQNEILTEEHDWDTMVKLLSERPVVVVFKRPPAPGFDIVGRHGNVVYGVLDNVGLVCVHKQR